MRKVTHTHTHTRARAHFLSQFVSAREAGVLLVKNNHLSRGALRMNRAPHCSYMNTVKPPRACLLMVLEYPQRAGRTLIAATFCSCQVMGYLRGVAAELIKLRTSRLSFEGRVLPPAHFGILIILARYIILVKSSILLFSLV